MCTDGKAEADWECDFGLRILMTLLDLGDTFVQAEREAAHSWIDIPFLSKYLTYFGRAASSRLEPQNRRLNSNLLYPKAE